MAVPEPTAVYQEKEFQGAILAAVKNLLGVAKRRFVVFEGFGLDVAIFIDTPPSCILRFLEVKVFGAQRMGGVGFGDGRGQGPQVNLLLSPEWSLELFDQMVRWVYADATQAPGTARYALFTCVKARSTAMGGVACGKQNNLRASELRDSLVNWTQLCAQIQGFLLS